MADPDFSRYHRQMLLPNWGTRGQHAMHAAHIAIVGAGALGSVVAEQLCRAGLGTITLIDRDVVELTNLQRQALYSEADLGKPKVDAAQARLQQINSAVKVFAEATDLRADNAEAALGINAQRPAAIIDGTDNFQTRYLLNDVAVKHGIPLIYAGAIGTCGTTTTILPGITPCLRCLQPLPPDPGTVPTCDTAGVLGSITALIASIEASAAIHLVIGAAAANPAPNHSALPSALLSVDLRTGTFRTLDISSAKNLDCPCCGLRQFPFLAGAHEPSDRTLCGRNTVQITPTSPRHIQLAELASRLSTIGPCRSSGQSVTVTLPGDNPGTAATEVTVFKDGRVLVSGTTDIARARSIVGRILG